MLRIDHIAFHKYWLVFVRNIVRVTTTSKLTYFFGRLVGATSGDVSVGCHDES